MRHDALVPNRPAHLARGFRPPQRLDDRLVPDTDMHLLREAQVTHNDWIDVCLHLIDHQAPPMSERETQAFQAKCNQEVANAEWRRLNPPQKDLFSRG